MKKSDTRVDINQKRYQFCIKILARREKSAYLCIVKRLEPMTTGYRDLQEKRYFLICFSRLVFK